MHLEKQKAAEWAEALLAFSQGKSLQYRMLYHDTGSTSQWNDWTNPSTITIKEDIQVRVKPEPKYRPFNSAEEFKPHRDRWVIRKDRGNTACGCVHHYSDSHVAFNVDESTRNVEWHTAFEKLLFEDGTPFGIQCEE